MPKGLACARWDDKTGLRVVGVYPRGLDVSEDDMLRVFTAHAMGKPEAGFLTMTLEGTNLAVASFYTGIMRGRDQFCIMLFLELEEDARSFEEGLTLAGAKRKIQAEFEGRSAEQLHPDRLKKALVEVRAELQDLAASLEKKARRL